MGIDSDLRVDRTEEPYCQLVRLGMQLGGPQVSTVAQILDRFGYLGLPEEKREQGERFAQIAVDTVLQGELTGSGARQFLLLQRLMLLLEARNAIVHGPRGR